MNSFLQLSICSIRFLFSLALGKFWTVSNQFAIKNEQRLLMSEIVDAQATPIDLRLLHCLADVHFPKPVLLLNAAGN